MINGFLADAIDLTSFTKGLEDFQQLYELASNQKCRYLHPQLEYLLQSQDVQDLNSIFCQVYSLGCNRN